MSMYSKEFTLSLRWERNGSKGIHNGRQFDVDNATHIETSRSSQNKYYTWNKGFGDNLQTAELEFYKTHYSKYLEIKNQNAIKAGHKERVQTIEQYFRSRNSCPEEGILQLGNVHDSSPIDPKTLWKMALKFKDDIQRLSGCVVLSMALHMDEATPHVHIRRTYPAMHKKYNVLYECQTELLKEYGESNVKTNRYVNNKTRLTEQERSNMIIICQEHNIDIVRSTEPKHSHMGTKEYKAKEIVKEVELLERKYDIRFPDISSRLDKLKEEEENNRKLKEHLARMIDEVKRKLYLLIHNPHDLFVELFEKEKRAKKRAEEYIKSQKLWDKYQSFIKEQEMYDLTAHTLQESKDRTKQASHDHKDQIHTTTKRISKKLDDHDDR